MYLYIYRRTGKSSRKRAYAWIEPRPSPTQPPKWASNTRQVDRGGARRRRSKWRFCFFVTGVLQMRRKRLADVCNEVEEAREEFYLHAKHKEPTNALKRPTWARANVGHLRMQVTWSFLGEKEKKRWFAGVCCGVRIRNKNGKIISIVCAYL